MELSNKKNPVINTVTRLNTRLNGICRPKAQNLQPLYSPGFQTPLPPDAYI